MNSDFKQYEKDEKTDMCYGLETFIITQDDIDHLIKGGKLYTCVNCCEYAIEIMMESESNNE